MYKKCWYESYKKNFSPILFIDQRTNPCYKKYIVEEKALIFIYGGFTSKYKKKTCELNYLLNFANILTESQKKRNYGNYKQQLRFVR